MKEVKKVLIGLISIIVLLVVADRTVGTWSEKMYYNSKYGIFRRQIYCMQESHDELLIMGSSRANHQYVTSIFEDSLGMKAYNAGSEGMCIYYQYAILSAYVQRKSFPKLVVLDVQDLDIIPSSGATFTLDAALDRLAPHYGQFDGVDSLFVLQNWKERVKQMSKTYRYNSKLVQTIKCNYLAEPEDKGYEVVKGKLPDDVVFENEASTETDFEPMKVEYMQKFIDLCKNNNIPLLLVYSPIFRNGESPAMRKIAEMAKASGVPFWDYSNEPTIIKRENFRDKMHLHDEGAHLWSEFLANMIKEKYESFN